MPSRVLRAPAQSATGHWIPVPGAAVLHAPCRRRRSRPFADLHVPAEPDRKLFLSDSRPADKTPKPARYIALLRQADPAVGGDWPSKLAPAPHSDEPWNALPLPVPAR